MSSVQVLIFWNCKEGEENVRYPSVIICLSKSNVMSRSGKHVDGLKAKQL